jgi:hypothetical protein
VDDKDKEAEDSASHVSTSPPNIQDAMLLDKDTYAILNLHAQVVAVQNIRSLIPLVIDLKTGNYNR